jgi:hypothetical protein
MIIRLYSYLLRLYPHTFYTRFGAEMLDVFTQTWADRVHTISSTCAVFLCEFGGLLVSILTERWRTGYVSVMSLLYSRRAIPCWLLIISLVVGACVSSSYWGYVIVPPSTVTAMHTVDHIALVQFKADYIPSIVPLENMPKNIHADFPPSQILEVAPTNLPMDKALDPVLLQQLATAMKREHVELGFIATYPSRPVVNPDGCGMNCFSPGVQPQPDGSLLIIYPEIIYNGQPPVHGFTQRVTPDDPWYYSVIAPAGYLVQGHDKNGTALVILSMATGAVGNDRYRYHELTFTQDANGLLLQNRLSYNFDIAGMEGFTYPLIVAVIFLLLLFLWCTLLGIRRVAHWRSVA